MFDSKDEDLFGEKGGGCIHNPTPLNLPLLSTDTMVQVTQCTAYWSYGSKYSNLKKTLEIHLVMLTEVCGKVLSEKYAYKSIKTALLLSNVIDADHQNSQNKDRFSLP